MNKNLLNKLGQAEKEFLNSEFVAPIFFDSVYARVSNIVMAFEVVPPKYKGWAILKPKNYRYAEVVNEAPRNLKNNYLSILPKFTMLVCDVENCLGVILNSDNRISSHSPIPFYLAENVELFTGISVGFDGNNFIYAGRSNAFNRKYTSILNEAIDKNIDPRLLNFKGQNKKAVLSAYCHKYIAKEKELLGQKEYRIKLAIERAGGKYNSYKDTGDSSFTVSYEIEGRKYTSTIKNDMQVISAGICLSGGDKAFDLQSLITVVREGQQRSAIYQYNEDDYYD